MNKILKVSICMCLIICFTLFLTSCDKSEQKQTVKQETIGNVNYSSLTEAVENAKSGDTIKIYNDLKDNKNVVINKPLTIKGILDDSRLKPKFYGSLTIDTKGKNDEVNIENLEIIHKGTIEDGQNNDTRIGVNLINGGLSFKSNLVALDDINNADIGATGMIISRRINSLNTKPIVIRGNTFETYKPSPDVASSAIIIKSNLPSVLQKLALNEGELYNQNSFSTSKGGNLMISADYSNNPASYSFFATGSIEELTKALKNNQDSTGSTFVLYPSTPLSEDQTEPYIVSEKTYLYIEGNNPANFNDATFKLGGSMVINSGIENATIEKTSDTANVMFGNDAKQNNITIKNKD